MIMKQSMPDANGVNMNVKEFFSKKTVIFGIVSTIICAFSFIWFTNTCGYQGTLNWHKAILLATRLLMITVFSPAIFLIINLIKKQQNVIYSGNIPHLRANRLINADFFVIIEERNSRMRDKR